MRAPDAGKRLAGVDEPILGERSVGIVDVGPKLGVGGEAEGGDP